MRYPCKFHKTLQNNAKHYINKLPKDRDNKRRRGDLLSYDISKMKEKNVRQISEGVGICSKIVSSWPHTMMILSFLFSKVVSSFGFCGKLYKT